MYSVDMKVGNIDRNPRVQIIDEGSILSDILYKVCGFIIGGEMVKEVSVLNAAYFERDDCFYYENYVPLFSGHMINFRSN
ncbi:MAG: hypothetical protein GY816_05540 [Cytophagales bacterium]|nr:hypothetical protein [Cytophagales bacterium]